MQKIQNRSQTLGGLGEGVKMAKSRFYIGSLVVSLLFGLLVVPFAQAQSVAPFSADDQQQIDGLFAVIEKAVLAGGLFDGSDKVKEIISPNASDSFGPAIFQEFPFKGDTASFSLTDRKQVPYDNAAQAKFSATLNFTGEMNFKKVTVTTPAYFVFEKVDSKWYLLDSDFYQKFSGDPASETPVSASGATKTATADSASSSCKINGKTVPCNQGLFKYFLAFFAGLWLVLLAVVVLIIVSLWKIFTKAGKPGWAAIIPIYNTVVMLEIGGKPGWWVLLLFVPFLNIVIGIIILYNFARAFGKGTGFVFGLIFLPFIFYPILAFGKSQYIGTVPPNTPQDNQPPTTPTPSPSTPAPTAPPVQSNITTDNQINTPLASTPAPSQTPPPPTAPGTEI